MAKWRDVKQNRNQKKTIESIKNSSKDDLASIPSRLKAFLTDTFLITTPIFYIVIYLIMGVVLNLPKIEV
jgi:capsule polysaccharide export protein KpsE/RkpR